MTELSRDLMVRPAGHEPGQHGTGGRRNLMAWTYLILAGLCEVVYAALLKKTQGFTQPLPTALFLVAVVSIFVLLALAAREIPIGTAYAVYPPSVSPARQRSALFSIMSPPPRSVCSSW